MTVYPTVEILDLFSIALKWKQPQCQSTMNGYFKCGTCKQLNFIWQQIQIELWKLHVMDGAGITTLYEVTQTQ